MTLTTFIHYGINNNTNNNNKFSHVKWLTKWWLKIHKRDKYNKIKWYNVKFVLLILILVKWHLLKGVNISFILHVFMSISSRRLILIFLILNAQWKSVKIFLLLMIFRHMLMLILWKSITISRLINMFKVEIIWRHGVPLQVVRLCFSMMRHLIIIDVLFVGNIIVSSAGLIIIMGWLVPSTGSVRHSVRRTGSLKIL